MLKANGGTLGAKLTAITAEFATGTADSIAKKLDDAIKNNGAAQALDFSTSYGKFVTAVNEATNLIDEALKSNDLTELDTTNLKALRSYINETKDTFDTAVKDAGFISSGSNDAAKVTKEALAKLQSGLDSATELGKTATEKATATSSKAAMKDLLGDDGATGTVGAELGEITKALTNNTTGIQKLVETAAGGTPAQGQTTVDLNVSTAIDALKTAVEKATEAIDEKLETGDLTQLDTSNLKALRSSINDIQYQLESAFKDLGVDTTKATKIEPEKAKELLSALESRVFKSNTELGEKAVGVATSSQKQAETISEMRDQLRGFAANPKAAGLESVNFTGYLETVDAALSNISDQRAKLGASQNETATSSIRLNKF